MADMSDEELDLLNAACANLTIWPSRFGHVATTDVPRLVAEIRRLRAELAEAREIASAVERLCPSKEVILEIVHEKDSWFVHNTEGTDGYYCSTNAGQGPTLLAALRAAVVARKEASDGR